MFRAFWKKEKKTVVTKWASVSAHPDFIYIVAGSGRFGVSDDADAYSEFLSPSVDSVILAQSLRDALRHSQYIESAKARREFLSPENINKRYNDYRAEIKKRFGTKTNRSLYTDLKHLSVELKGGLLCLKPTSPDYRGGFDGSGIKATLRVELDVNISDEELGQKIRDALRVCG